MTEPTAPHAEVKNETDNVDALLETVNATQTNEPPVPEKTLEQKVSKRRPGKGMCVLFVLCHIYCYIVHSDVHQTIAGDDVY